MSQSDSITKHELGALLADLTRSFEAKLASVTSEFERRLEQQQRETPPPPSSGRRTFVVLAGPGQEAVAERLVALDPQHFAYYPSVFGKFPDQTDNIELGGFTPTNRIRGGHILFIASFHNNDVSMSQFHALIALCESFVASLTILLPFLPTATMERVTKEGKVATANTTAKMLSALPSVGTPTRVMLYDLHTLQNRFYFGNHAVATLHSTFPLLIDIISNAANGIDTVCFPDDGACKRYGYFFKKAFPHMELVWCPSQASPIL
jgi:phosphoribosylpyrophosphate synthetase